MEDWILQRPFWLFALVPLAVLGLFLFRRATTADAWAQVMDDVMMLAMTRLGRRQGTTYKSYQYPLAAAACVIIALAGPSVLNRDKETFRNLDGIVLVLDMSASMTEGQRFEEIITATRFLVHKTGTRQIALVVFAGDSYIASPLTYDWRAIDSTLSLLDQETMPDAGSRINLGLEHAQRVLEDADIHFGDIVLISDAEGLLSVEPELVQSIANEGVQVSILLAETTNPAMAEHLVELGQGVATTLDAPEKLSKPLASGLFARLTNANYTVVVWQDYGRYLLIFACLFLLFGLMRTHR